MSATSAPAAHPAAANCTGRGRSRLIAHAAIWRTKPIAAAIKSGRAYVPKPSLEPRNLDALAEKVPIPRLRPEECHAHSARAAGSRWVPTQAIHAAPTTANPQAAAARTRPARGRRSRIAQSASPAATPSTAPAIWTFAVTAAASSAPPATPIQRLARCSANSVQATPAIASPAAGVSSSPSRE